MNRLNYLKLALQLKLFAKRAWVISAFSITKGSNGKTYPGMLVSHPWGFSFINSEGLEEKIEDSVANEPLLTFKERIKVDPTWISNVTEPSEIKELLGRQVYSSVKWQQSVERMIADGVDTFIEIGPGRTLSGFVKKVNRDVKVSSIDKMEDFIQFIGSHVEAGAC